MSAIKEAIAAEVALTMTLNSLASSGTAGRESTVVDNSTNLYLDALVSLALAWTSASSSANDKAVYVYAHGSTDGTNYAEGLTGADANYTILGTAGDLRTSLRLIGVVPCQATVPTTASRYGPWSVASGFGGILPVKWGLVVLNYSGIALKSTLNTAQYCGVSATVV